MLKKLRQNINEIFKQNFYAATLATSFLLLILSFSLFTFAWGDDFAWIKSLVHEGPFHYSWRRYFEFEGRSIGIQSIFKTVLFYIFLDEVRPIIFFWITSFILAGVYAKKYFFKRLDIQVENIYMDYLITITIVLIIWASLHKILGVIAYWATGGSYSVVMLFFFFLIFLLEKYKAKESFKDIGWIIFLSYNIGTGGFYINAAFLVFLVFYLIETIWIKRLTFKKAWQLLTYNILPFLIGAVIIFISPGNKGRIDIMHYQVFYDLYHIILNSVKLLDMSLVFFWKNILLGAILLALLLLTIRPKLADKLLFLEFLKWLGIGVSVIFSFSPIVKAFSYHTAYLFVLGMVFIIGIIVYLLFTWIEKFLNIKLNINLDKYIFFLLIIGIARLGADVFKQYNFYKTEYQPFMIAIKEHRFHSLEVCPYDLGKAPYRIRKIRPNANNWLNVAMSTYYGLKSIKMRTNCKCEYIDNLQDYEITNLYRNTLWKLKPYKKCLDTIKLIDVKF